MADIRINALATTAASTASDDFIAVDGSANGTRKLNAFSPTFGGTLTVNGAINAVGQSIVVSPSSGTAKGRINSDPFRADVIQVGSNWTGGAQDDATKPSWYWFFDSRVAGDSATLFRVPAGGSPTSALAISSTGATLAGNLTVSGTGNSSFAGNIRLPWSTPSLLSYYDATYSLGFVFDSANRKLVLRAQSADAPANGKGTIAFESGATPSEIARFAPSTGNFLLGTTTDGGQKLQVNGTSNFSNPGSSTIANFTNSANADFQIVLTASTSAKIGPSTATSLILQTNNTTALTLDSSQNATFAGKITANGAGSTFKGTSTNDDAAAGYVGEIITSTVESGSAVSLTSATLANITSISLTAGDWDVFGVVGYSLSGATVQSFLNALNNTSAAIGPTGSYTKDLVTLTTITDNALLPTPVYRFTLTSTSTVYLIGRANFTAGTVSGWGHIRARRVR